MTARLDFPGTPGFEYCEDFVLTERAVKNFHLVHTTIEKEPTIVRTTWESFRTGWRIFGIAPMSELQS
jgi:hypothetical protein